MSSNGSEDPSSATTGGFLYALGFGSAAAVILVVVFSIMRSRIPDVFELRRLLNTWKSHDDFNGKRVGVTEPRPSATFLGWIGPVFSTTEEEVIAKVGLDAAMFFRFIRSAFQLVSLMSLFGLVVIMPTYGTGGLRDTEEGSSIQGLEVVSLSNVPPGNGRFWVTVLSEIATAAAVIFFAARDFKHYSVLRRKYRASSNPVNYSIVVYDIPKDCRSETAIRDRFELVVPGQVAEVIVIRNPSKALKLQKKLDAAVAKREAAEFIHETKGTEPQTRPGPVGFLMCWKPKVNAQSHWAQEQDRLASEIFDLGATAEETPSAIVVLSSKNAASLLVQANSTQGATKWHVERAPEPEGLHWGAFSIPGYQAELRSIAVAAFMFFFTIFWSIPATFIIALVNLSNLSSEKGFEWLKFVLDLSPAVTSLIEGLLPPVLMNVLISLIPTIFRLVIGLERIASTSIIEVKTRDYFFVFSLYGSFLVLLIGSAFFEDIEKLSKNFTLLIDKLAVRVPGTSVYFATFILTKCMISFPLMMSGIIRVILRWILLKLAKTERQKRKARSGGSVFQYFRQYGFGMLVLFLCQAFSSFAPIVPMAGMIYFGLAYICFRYVILYTSYSAWDGGGELFPGTFWGLMFGLVFKQLIVIAVLGLKKAPAPAIVCLIPTVATMVMTFIISKRFSRIGENGSLMDLYVEGRKMEDVPHGYRSIYDQPAGKVENYENLNGIVDIRDVYSEVEYEDQQEAEHLDAVQSETMDVNVGYVPDPAANREDV